MKYTNTNCHFTDAAVKLGVPHKVIAGLEAWDRAYLRNTYREKPELVVEFLQQSAQAIGAALHALYMPAEVSERLWSLALTEAIPKLDVFEWEREQCHAPGYGNFQLEQDTYGYIGCIVAQDLVRAGVDLPHNIMCKYLPRAMRWESVSMMLDDASSELAEFIIDITNLHREVCVGVGEGDHVMSAEEYVTECERLGWKLIEISYDSRFVDLE